MTDTAAQPDFTPLLMQNIWPRVRDLPPNGVRALPAATLILIDRKDVAKGGEPKVLMGRRNAAVKFMPGKFVFPGGRVEAADREMVAAGALASPVQTRLAAIGRSASFPRALALAAIRELFEETGLLLGVKDYGAPETAPEGDWRRFADNGVYPDLGAIHFIARAITPPRISKRFDTFFLAAEADAICDRIEGCIGPDKELVELVWTPIRQAYALDIATITSVVLRELEWRIAAGFAHELPVPSYGAAHPGGWARKLL